MMNINSIGGYGQYNNQINESKNEADKALEKIAVMHDISSLDGSNQMIMDGIRQEFDTLTAGIQNANEFTGMMRIADNALQNITSQTDELTAMSVRYNNAALSSDDRSIMQRQAQGIVASMNQTLSTTTYNGKRIMSGEEMGVHDGQSLIRVTLNQPNTSNLNIEDQDSMREFSKSVHRTLSDIGSTQNQLEVSVNKNSNAMVNQASIYNSNFDLGEQMVKFEKEKLLMQSSQFAQSMSTQYIQKQILGVLQ
jgi:flagellin